MQVGAVIVLPVPAFVQALAILVVSTASKAMLLLLEESRVKPVEPYPLIEFPRRELYVSPVAAMNVVVGVPEIAYRMLLPIVISESVAS